MSDLLKRVYKAGNMKLQAASQKLEFIIKEWEVFYGPRGGLGVRDDESGQREYGHNAERRIKVRQRAGSGEETMLTIDEMVQRIHDGKLEANSLPSEQLQAISASLQGKPGIEGWEKMVHEQVKQALGGQ